jgi:hypothetical protein
VCRLRGRSKLLAIARGTCRGSGGCRGRTLRLGLRRRCRTASRLRVYFKSISAIIPMERGFRGGSYVWKNFRYVAQMIMYTIKHDTVQFDASSLNL